MAGQESIQRSRHRGTIESRAPARPSHGSPMYPSWHALGVLQSTLTTEEKFLRMVLLLAACTTTAALRLFSQYLQKIYVIAVSSAHWRGDRRECLWCNPFPEREEYLWFRLLLHSSEGGWAGIGTFPPLVY